MGVLAVEYINSPVNNPSFTNSPTGAIGGTALNQSYSMDLPRKMAISGLSRILPKPLQYGALLASELSQLYSSFQDGISEGIVSEITEFDAFRTDVSSQVAEMADMLTKIEDFNQSSKTSFEEQIDATAPTDTDILPDIFSRNGQALVNSLSIFSDIFSNKMDTLNSAVTGLLIYFNDYMNLKTEHIPLQIEALKYNIASQGDNLSPRETEYYKNLSVFEKNEFMKNAVSDDLLNITNVQGLSPREIQVSKQSFDIEDKVFNMTQQPINDLDGQSVANLSPRDATLIKNASQARMATDENNFELEQDDLDIADFVDISSIFGYEKITDDMKDIYSKIGEM